MWYCAKKNTAVPLRSEMGLKLLLKNGVILSSECNLKYLFII
jgi:hypothetical protein